MAVKLPAEMSERQVMRGCWVSVVPFRKEWRASLAWEGKSRADGERTEEHPVQGECRLEADADRT